MSASRAGRPDSSPESRDRTRTGGADAERTQAAGTVRVCPLCGGRIKDSSENEHCPTCPVAKHCKILCCPNCGYEFVEDSALVSGVAGLIRRLRRRGKG